jgi:hypothetical protein
LLKRLNIYFEINISSKPLFDEWFPPLRLSFQFPILNIPHSKPFLAREESVKGWGNKKLTGNGESYPGWYYQAENFPLFNRTVIFEPLDIARKEENQSKILFIQVIKLFCHQFWQKKG